ncbi:MAG: hslR [Alphaproteobacteria bacterium]|jgi:ribosome-associated heat shock protein Hsp15|nr:hslR [Alphaproteobacteria bacterium]
MSAEVRPSLRLDKYLWQARFFKSRSQAAAYIAEGRLRLDGGVVIKPNQPVRIGCVLTFPLGARIRVVRVLALGVRRGPPAEARTLYEDLETPSPGGKTAVGSGN